jgi:hypothetical protein
MRRIQAVSLGGTIVSLGFASMGLAAAGVTTISSKTMFQLQGARNLRMRRSSSALNMARTRI